MRKLILNIGELATPFGRNAWGGSDQRKRVSRYKKAWLLLEDGKVLSLGTGDPGGIAKDPDTEILDAGGCLVTPGLVDAHTHLVFGGSRQNELALKLKGVTYLEILARGGGILSTVAATRRASEEELYEKARKDLEEMLKHGITTVEIKSGYGLDQETEMKQLRVVKRLSEEGKQDLAATFLGAHALPPEYKDNREAFIRLLTDKVIPKVAEEGLAEFCDVFCETGVFTVSETRRILEAGKAYGLVPKIHADEIDAIGGSELTKEVGAISAEHLIQCKESGIQAMREAGTVACLLPATSFYLGATYAPARAMIEAGVPVAMVTDYNPGSCPSLNLQFVMNLGCLRCKLTPEEVLTAVTLNAAAAINRADRLGSLEPGKQADFVIWDAPDLEYICYRMGSNLAKQVYKKGERVC